MRPRTGLEKGPVDRRHRCYSNTFIEREIRQVPIGHRALVPVAELFGKFRSFEVLVAGGIRIISVDVIPLGKFVVELALSASVPFPLSRVDLTLVV